MKAPFVIIDKDAEDFPFLIQCAEDLYEHPEELSHYVLYGVEGCYTAEVAPIGKRPGFLSRLLGARHESYSIRFSSPVPYEIDELKQKLSAHIDADDDCLTQYHEAAVLQYLLKDCRTFAEVVAMGCITGMFEPSGHNLTLPELCEDDITDSEADALSVISGADYHGALTMKNIRDKAAKIGYDALPDSYQC